LYNTRLGIGILFGIAFCGNRRIVPYANVCWLEIDRIDVSSGKVL
jgi:hypothetical protein